MCSFRGRTFVFKTKYSKIFQGDIFPFQFRINGQVSAGRFGRFYHCIRLRRGWQCQFTLDSCGRHLHVPLSVPENSTRSQTFGHGYVVQRPGRWPPKRSKKYKTIQNPKPDWGWQRFEDQLPVFWRSLDIHAEKKQEKTVSSSSPRRPRPPSPPPPSIDGWMDG